MARVTRVPTRDVLEQLNLQQPAGWTRWTRSQQLDYMASRIIASDRGWARNAGGAKVTSHRQMKESGILSNPQYGRRYRREVYSNFGSLDEVPPEAGVFGRKHVSKSPRLRSKLDEDV